MGTLILSFKEKNGGGVNGFDVASEELCSIVDALELHDFSLEGSSFIYFGSGQNVTRSRIDKFLVSDGAGA